MRSASYHSMVSPADVHISLGNMDGKWYSGEKRIIPVVVRSGEQTFDGAEVHLEFDPTILRVDSIISGDILPFKLLSEISNSRGEVAYAAGALEDLPSGDFTLFALVVEVISESTETEIRFSGGNPGETMVTYAGRSILGGYTDGKVQPQKCDTCPTDNGISIYPNPTRDILRIDLPSVGEEVEITLMGTDGRVYSVEKVFDSQATLDLSERASGIYLIQIDVGGEKKVYRIVKY